MLMMHGANMKIMERIVVSKRASAPHNTTGLISVLYNIILVPLDKSLLVKRFIAAKISSIAGQDTSLCFFFYAVIITD